MLRPLHGVLQILAAQIVDHEGRSSWLEKPPVSAVTRAVLLGRKAHHMSILDHLQKQRYSFKL
jgi:hypothetical protein